MAWLAMIFSSGVAMMVVAVAHAVYGLSIWGLFLLYCGLGAFLGTICTCVVMAVCNPSRSPRRK